MKRLILCAVILSSTVAFATAPGLNGNPIVFDNGTSYETSGKVGDRGTVTTSDGKNYDCNEEPKKCLKAISKKVKKKGKKKGGKKNKSTASNDNDNDERVRAAMKLIDQKVKKGK
jgi:hypothetical protein